MQGCENYQEANSERVKGGFQVGSPLFDVTKQKNNK